MKKVSIQPGSKQAPDKFQIIITEAGPLLVYGSPPLAQQFIMTNNRNDCLHFKQGRSFHTDGEPTALCRCGAAKNKPYCDGAHFHIDWSPELTAINEPLLENAVFYKGPRVSLSDNERYCASARFCDPDSSVWALVEKDDAVSAEKTVYQSNHCPAGRLSAWDNETGKPFEPDFEPSLGLIEDPAIGSSGPLWVRGGILISKEDGETYEVRNRVTLCRCGKSYNKPFCDGTHCRTRFNDSIGGLPEGEEF